MTDRIEDDEPVHWRARADAIPDRTPEAATERAQIDILADYLMEHYPESITGGGAADVAIRVIESHSAALAERDAEIGRYEGWLNYIMASMSHNPFGHVSVSCVQALAGEASPDLALRAERSAE